MYIQYESGMGTIYIANKTPQQRRPTIGSKNYFPNKTDET
jgi:hypothetical protein